MKILIIGGSGRISLSVTKYLLKQGHMIYILNRGKKMSYIPGAILIRKDIRNIEDVDSALDKEYFDIIIDFLVYSLADAKQRTFLFRDRVRHYIFISSMTVCNATDNIYYNEESLVGNRYSEYAKNKIICEKYFLQQYNDNLFPVTIIRPTQTYDNFTVPMAVHGKMGSWQNIQRILQNKKIIIHDNGRAFWSATRSEDFAVWVSDVSENDDSIGEIIQISTDEYMTWNQIYEIISDEIGKELRASYINSKTLAEKGKAFNLREMLLGDKARSMIFDNTKLHSFSNYRPRLNMEEGIREAVKNTLENPYYQITDIDYEVWCNDMIVDYE